MGSIVEWQSLRRRSIAILLSRRLFTDRSFAELFGVRRPLRFEPRPSRQAITIMPCTSDRSRSAFAAGSVPGRAGSLQPRQATGRQSPAIPANPRQDIGTRPGRGNAIPTAVASVFQPAGQRYIGWHPQSYSLRVPEVYQALETSPEGLAAAEVEARRSLYGDQRAIGTCRVTPSWRRFVAHIGPSHGTAAVGRRRSWRSQPRARPGRS